MRVSTKALSLHMECSKMKINRQGQRSPAANTVLQMLRKEALALVCAARWPKECKRMS